MHGSFSAIPHFLFIFCVLAWVFCQTPVPQGHSCSCTGPPHAPGMPLHVTVHRPHWVPQQRSCSHTGSQGPHSLRDVTTPGCSALKGTCHPAQKASCQEVLQHVSSHIPLHVPFPDPSSVPPFMLPHVPPPVLTAASSYHPFLTISEQWHYVLLWSVQVLACGGLFSPMSEPAVTSAGQFTASNHTGALQPLPLMQPEVSCSWW